MVLLGTISETYSPSGSVLQCGLHRVVELKYSAGDSRTTVH